MSALECKNPLVYEELNKLVVEYLEINGLERTLETFTSECRSKSLPCPPITGKPECKAAFSQYDATKMMKLFDDGELENFFTLWRIFQSHIQVTSDDMAKLEVYIRVHFSLWPRAHNQPKEKQEKAINELKHFFEREKSSLGRDTSIIPLYALPFVEDPFTHPIFKELFRDSWTMKLRNQLESTTQRYFELLQENICQHSRLAELIIKGERYEEANFKGESSHNQDRFYQLLGNHRKIRKLLQGTRESYAKLLLVTHELVVGLEQSISGPSIPMDSVLDKCFYVFPEIFIPKNATEAEAGKPNVEYFKQISSTANIDPTQDSEVSLFFLGISNVSPEFLDFIKIKETLVRDTTTTVSEKLCLLQALRWLITRTTEKCREIAIHAFVENDVFGISQTDNDFRDKLFHCMSFPTPTYQKECLSRLVNTVSSTRTGRNYISSTTFIIDSLVKSLTTFIGPTESFICQMVVATLQKLSLKKSMRLFMIEHKVIDWLIGFIKKELDEQTKNNQNNNSNEEIDKQLDDNGNFNPYLMEYAWALLMNLCLHEEAWISCIQNGKDLINTSSTMLQMTPRKDLAPYVVSTLYSLLRCPEMYTLAMEIKLEELVAPLLNDNTELSEHLNNLISLLYMKGCDRITSSRETNYDDDDSPDPDVFEPEIELSESWTTSLEEKELTGDDLLVRKYLVDKAEPVVPVVACTPSQTHEKRNPNLNGEFKRPITPSNVCSNAFKGRKPSQSQLQNFSFPPGPAQKKMSKINLPKAKPSTIRAANSREVFSSTSLASNKTSFIDIKFSQRKSVVGKKPKKIEISGSPYAKPLVGTKGKGKSFNISFEGDEAGKIGSMDPGIPVQLSSDTHQQ